MKCTINIIKEFGFFFINYTRGILYYIFIQLFPLENSVFVDHFDGKPFGDNPKYILLELFRRGLNVEVYWVAKKDNDITLPSIHYVKPFSIEAIYRQAVSSIWISTVRLPYYSIKRENQLYIQTWHGGLAFKKIEKECEHALSSRYIRTAKKDSTMIDYYISNNSNNTEQFKKAFWYQSGQILEIGSPRNDIFFNNNDNKLREKYGFKGKKIVLYAPTFRVKDSFKSYDIDFFRLRTALEKRFGGQWIVVVRLHPRLADISHKFIIYDQNIINGSLIEDIQEMLVITDFLITDYSSIVFDYINTKKPAVLYASDIDEYKKDRDFHIRLEDTPFKISTKNEDLIRYIVEFDYDDYKRKLDNFTRRISFFDNGSASSKIADIIQEKIASSGL